MKFSPDVVKHINKQYSKFKKYIAAKQILLQIFFVRLIGNLLSIFSDKEKANVPVQTLEIKSDQQVVVNCMGCIDLQSDINAFDVDLKSIFRIFEIADISFASARFGKRKSDEYQLFTEKLEEHKIVDVSAFNSSIKSCMYDTPQGKIAVVSYMQNYSFARNSHIRLELAKTYYSLKKMGAEYVLLYIDNKQIYTVSEKSKQLCDIMLNVGFDYIVNVRPHVCDSGVTFRQRNSSVSRAVYGIGTFLSNRSEFPEERVIIRLKLRKVNGKLQAFEEAYYPIHYRHEKGLKNLIRKNVTLDSSDIDAFVKIEQSMPRLRSIDSIITVKSIVKAIGAELPPQYKYIEDFSVGRISARYNVHKPGDVYVRWQPHTESNDVDTYSERVRYARKSTKAAEKIDMFIVTYKDFGIKTPHVVVKDALEAHIAIGTLLRKKHNFKCVAITGSIGKTSTKDMLAEVMKQQFNTVKSSKNENIHSKISLALQQIPRDCEVYIQELGGGRPGGASRHSRMVLPDYTVVTNIGDAHLGNFDGSKELLMQNKLEIIHGMPKRGVLFLNADDPLLVNARPDCKTVFFAVHNKNADFYAENIVTANNKTTFYVVHKGVRYSARVNVPGEHNVLNAVCAFAIGKQFKIPYKKIIKGIANFKTQGIRQNIVPACGIKMFLDCYNASSGSFESSIKTLSQIKKSENGKRIALLGDITGLGEMTQSAHTEIAVPLIENPADVFIFYGKNIRYTYEAVKAHGLECHYVSTEKALFELLPKIVNPGDVLMLKGSSKMKLEYVLDRMYGTRFYDNVLLEEGNYYRISHKGIEYNLFNSHATAVKTDDESAFVKVRPKIGVVEVNNISSSFRSPSLERVILPDTIYHIGVGAFKDCTALRTIEGATKLKYIGVSAFNNCSSLQAFTIPETVLHIGNKAFFGCTGLKELHIPASVVQIGPNAFDECPQLKITCKAGSYAEEYLKTTELDYTCV